MKTTKIKIGLIALVAVGFAMNACKKSTSENIKNQVENNVVEGNWKITKFIDSGDDETANFSGYVITFESGGVLNANNTVNDYNGTWSIDDSNSNDDSQDDLDFNIHFNLTNIFEDLNDDWDIVSQSETKIELIDVSGGNGGTDFLTFEKN